MPKERGNKHTTSFILKKQKNKSNILNFTFNPLTIYDIHYYKIVTTQYSHGWYIIITITLTTAITFYNLQPTKICSALSVISIFLGSNQKIPSNVFATEWHFSFLACFIKHFLLHDIGYSWTERFNNGQTGQTIFTSYSASPNLP